MSKQTINIGASPNDGTGTPLRTSFDYTNQNFTEIYTALGGGVALPGATTQVIFNDGGTNLAGDAGLVYNKTTDALTIAGPVNAASATITGDLTVRTTKLAVTSTGVGCGTATPANQLSVRNEGASGISVVDIRGGTGGAGALQISGNGTTLGTTSFDFIQNSAGAFILNRDATPLAFSVNGGVRYEIGTTGISTWSVAGTTAMTLNSTGLGIGASPSYKLDVAGSVMRLINSAATADFFITDSGTTNGNVRLRGESNAMKFITGGGVSATIDSSGNLGVGVTPSAWSSPYKCVQLNGGSLSVYPSTDLYLSQNAYNSGGWKRVAAGYASQYIQTNSEHRFLIAGTSTADSSTGFIQAMTLDASGNLMVGTTSLTGTERLNVTKTTVGSYLARFINTNTTVDTYGITVVYSASTPNDASHNFLGCTDSTTSRAFIYANGGLANFSANNVNLSDARTKTDIKPLTSYWNKIKALQMVTFKYKDQTHNDDNIGLISQQVESVAPEFVSNDGFGETPADGIPLKAIYTTDLYHAAIKALQEAMTRIEVLEAKLA